MIAFSEFVLSLSVISYITKTRVDSLTTNNTTNTICENLLKVIFELYI